MVGCFFGRFADNRNVQTSADDLGDLSSRYALIGDAMISGCKGPLLNREPVQMSSIEPVHCGPAITTVAHVRRNTFLTRDVDQAWHETVITLAVDRWGKPQHQCADSAGSERKCRLLRLTGEVR